ncbi:hypothetical protein niasHS_006156 [Heterodera schachtii]|uniref:Uncharacterized protein n=1 Tax=Heterodera schachtii TaxID=97005 RepID=A0ABD2JW42_HETSC
MLYQTTRGHQIQQGGKRSKQECRMQSNFLLLFLWHFWPLVYISFVSIILTVVCIVLCCTCGAEFGHSSLEVLYKCPTCGKETHRNYECFIDISYNWSRRHGDTEMFRYRIFAGSLWGQYTANVTKTVLQKRMTMNNFEVVEHKYDVMSNVWMGNYYKTTDDWTNDLIRRLV